jgi:hypothetical protein
MSTPFEVSAAKVAASDPIQSCDLIVHTEITIARSRSEVWTRFLRMRTWMIGVQFQAVAGEPNTVGEIRRVREAGGGSYLIRLVRIVLNREYVVKVYSDGDGQYFGYADFRFREHAGSTTMSYDIFVQSPYELGSGAAGQSVDCSAQEIAARDEIRRNNLNLKQLIEALPVKLATADHDPS